MNISERIPIVRKDGITIYGRVIGPGGKLGRYEVYSDMYGSEGHIYQTYSEAEARFDVLQTLNGRSKNK